MAKEILLRVWCRCWMLSPAGSASYGGEDSPDDISRGLFAGEVGRSAPLEAVRSARHQDHMVYPRPTRSRPFPPR